MKKTSLMMLLVLPLAACQTWRDGITKRADVNPPPVAESMALFAGEFDNHEQVWSAREQPSKGIAAPHVLVTLETTRDADWSVWRIHLDAATPLDAIWAMQRVDGADGSASMLPYRALVSAPASGTGFDARQWTPLAACALRGELAAQRASVVAEAAACAALAPGIGVGAALLPLAIEREGEWLHLRLYADQARGADAREDARKIETYAGWVAVNGAGPQGVADSSDWHVDRTLRLGSEGGRAALKWRDGKASGYSLGLERLTYRDGNIAVLKLSLTADQDGRTLAYAWTNPEATRIGLSLGWVQVGLQRVGGPAPSGTPAPSRAH